MGSTQYHWALNWESKVGKKNPVAQYLFGQEWGQCASTEVSNQTLTLCVCQRSSQIVGFSLFLFRIQLAEKFVKAVSKPSRPDMNPIR